MIYNLGQTTGYDFKDKDVEGVVIANITDNHFGINEDKDPADYVSSLDGYELTSYAEAGGLMYAKGQVVVRFKGKMTFDSTFACILKAIRKHDPNVTHDNHYIYSNGNKIAGGSSASNQTSHLWMINLVPIPQEVIDLYIVKAFTNVGYLDVSYDTITTDIINNAETRF